jgi:hypothetical protein
MEEEGWEMERWCRWDEAWGGRKRGRGRWKLVFGREDEDEGDWEGAYASAPAYGFA